MKTRHRKCPPGVFCVGNLTIVFFIICVLVLGYLIYVNLRISKEQSSQVNSQSTIKEIAYIPFQSKDVLQNPYDAPLSDQRYYPNAVPMIRTTSENWNRLQSNPIVNVSTNIGAVDTTYRQLGILTPLNGVNKDNILPLMGRPLFTSRSKFQYYTISNQHNNVKLPVSVQGKSALNEYGVDELFTGDTIYVEGYNDAFRATIYDNNEMKYLPWV